MKDTKGRKGTNRAKHISAATFTYPQRLVAKQIRLVELKHGRGKEDIHFDLRTYSLSEPPDYIALSYTWGDPKETLEVFCDGKVMKVTKNLQEALWQLRECRKSMTKRCLSKKHVSAPLYLWIDAICINQSDIDEKNCQVALMGVIYQQAYNVLVWLGPSDTTSDLTMDYLDRFGVKAEECYLDRGYQLALKVWQGVLSPTLLEEELKPFMFQITQRSLQRLFDSISGYDSQDDLLPLKGMSNFFTRSWWGRIWVLQEVALPKNVEIMCGTKMITRKRCSAVINAYLALKTVLTSRFISGGRLGRMTIYQNETMLSMFHLRANVMLSSRKLYENKEFPLVAWLRATCVGTINPKSHGPHHLDASDPRDKIFALLGLSTDQNELSNYGVVPDYNSSYEQVYAMAMAALLQQGHISLLSMCQIHKRPRSLASWIPDWSQSVTNMLQDIEDDHITLIPEFNASGIDREEAKVLIRRNGRAVEGIELACQLYEKICKTGMFPGRVATNKVPLRETRSWPQKWLLEMIFLTYQCEGERYRTFEDRVHAAVRCSIGDVGFDDDTKFARVGMDRLDDAVNLLGLRDGLKGIRHDRMASDIQTFLSSKCSRNLNQEKNILDNRLGDEIIGKSLDRLPFVTESGHLVLSSKHARPGDVIALVRGAQVPFILRPQSEGRYQIVSEAYVDGIMNGEAVSSEWSFIEIV